MTEKREQYLTVFMPKKVTVKLERLGADKWRLHYLETLDAPKGALQTTLMLFKKTGLKVRRRKNTLSFKIEGPEQVIFTPILAELLAISKFGNLTLREMLAFMGIAGTFMEIDRVQRGLSHPTTTYPSGPLQGGQSQSAGAKMAPPLRPAGAFKEENES